MDELTARSRAYRTPDATDSAQLVRLAVTLVNPAGYMA
jgi:hypothetical protein